MAARPSSWHKHTQGSEGAAVGGREGLTTTTTITTFLCFERWPVNQGFPPGYGGLASARSSYGWKEELVTNYRGIIANKH